MKQQEFQGPLLLKPEDAATLLGVSRTKVYALIAQGVIPMVRVGRRMRVPAEALRRWVERQVPGDCQGSDSPIPANARTPRPE